MSERLKNILTNKKNKVIKEFHFLLMLSFGLFFLKSKKENLTIPEYLKITSILNEIFGGFQNVPFDPLLIKIGDNVYLFFFFQ